MATELKNRWPNFSPWEVIRLYSVYDLAYDFISNRPNADEIRNDEKKEIIEDLMYLLKKGWVAEDLIKAIDKVVPRTQPAWNFRVREVQHYENPKQYNLIKPDEFYWHPQLRIFPSAPKRILDYDTGEITKVDEPYFLEIRASYTIRDLADYYFKQMLHDRPTEQDYKRVSGALRHLCANHNIDTVLFMIDAAANHVIEGDIRPIDTPLKIVDYLREAQNAMGAKMTEEIEAGDDKIVVRRRVPLGRGRSETSG